MRRLNFSLLMLFIKYLRLMQAFIHAFWILWVQFPRLNREEKLLAIQTWSAQTLAVMGVTVNVVGQIQRPPLSNTPQLLVANHVSWLDPVVIQTVQPSIFVAKQEVRRWPVVGAIAQACGVVFVNRGSPSSARKMVTQVAAAMESGHNVAGFPEGTSTLGHTVEMFHANLFESAIQQDVPVQPLALRYTSMQTGEHCTRAAFVGDVSFLSSLHQVMRARDGICITLHASPRLMPQGHSRKSLALLARNSVTTQLEALSAS
jgi:1-acyl-sn-glycerol-3-phosphate acyltransferase